MLGSDGTDARRDGADGRSPGGKPSPQESELLDFARLVGRELRLRGDMLAQIDEPRWMILLDIFVAQGEGRDTPFMSAAHASSVPVSTAQRYIHDMIENGLISQHRSGQDQRIMHVNLTETGRELVSRALGSLQALRSRR